MFGKLKNNLQNQWTRFQNKKYMEAVIAGCTLVAAADGNIDSSEKQKMLNLMQRLPELQVYEAAEIAKLFKHFVELLDFDTAIGKEEIFKTISQIKDNQDESRMVVRICCSIGEADGDFDADEKAVIIELCHHLGLDPAQFELT